MENPWSCAIKTDPCNMRPFIRLRRTATDGTFGITHSFFVSFPLLKFLTCRCPFFIHVSTPATELRILEQQTLKEFLPAHGVHDLRFASFFGYGVFISHFKKSSPSISLILNFSAYSLAPGENLEEDININTFLYSVFSSSHPALKSRISPGGMGFFQCLH